MLSCVHVVLVYYEVFTYCKGHQYVLFERYDKIAGIAGKDIHFLLIKTYYRHCEMKSSQRKKEKLVTIQGI